MGIFKEDLKSFSEEQGVTAIVYALLKDGQLKKLDIENKALDDLKNIFLNYIHDEILLNDEMHLLTLSSADERGNVIYEYDLDFPEDFNCINQVSDDKFPKPVFNNSKDDLGNIEALVVEIGNEKRQIVLYKTMANINVFRQKSFILGAVKTDRFERIDKDLLRVSPNFQFIKTNLGFFVLELKTLEKLFSFHTVIKKEATKSCSAIQDRSILENPETLIELIEDIKFARKLVKIYKSSPVLLHSIPNSEIIKFCEHYPSLKGRVRFNEAKNKILLDTKVSKELFIKVLMDDYLTSELTKLHYDTLAKNEFVELPEESSDLLKSE
ncbi:DUF4868 domain-containing protein [Acinetobacter pittii]|nr:DUF4868 domain-containing protein [Acinetobacter pittii]